MQLLLCHSLVRSNQYAPKQQFIKVIRKGTLSDFDFFYGLYMHPQVNPYLLYELMDEPTFRPIFEALIQQGVLYVFEVDGKPVGMSKLVPMQHRNSHIVYLGGVAIDPAAGGKGYGAIMLQQVIDYAVKMGSLRIELSVATNNKRAIGLYQKLGFVQEGLFKKFSYLKSENIYLDEIFMAWIKDEN